MAADWEDDYYEVDYNDYDYDDYYYDDEDWEDYYDEEWDEDYYDGEWDEESPEEEGGIMEQAQGWVSDTFGMSDSAMILSASAALLAGSVIV